MKTRLKAVDDWLYGRLTDRQFVWLMLLGALVTFAFLVRGLAEAQ